MIRATSPLSLGTGDRAFYTFSGPSNSIFVPTGPFGRCFRFISTKVGVQGSISPASTSEVGRSSSSVSLHKAGANASHLPVV